MKTTESMKHHIGEHQRLLGTVVEQVDLLERISNCLLECFHTGGKVLLLGNGGSAADAQHIAAELVGRFKVDRPAMPALALTTDTSILTAVANDIGAEQCFSRQVEALAGKRDVVWALSVSGKSPNVLRAVEAARRVGALVIGFTGRHGVPLKDRCDLCFMVDHEASDRVQEMHQLAYHLICESVEQDGMKKRE
jgi:D-sedoheptulose 7-phosphate isomerase